MSAPRPDLLYALPGLVAASILTVLPGLRSCKGMAGRFDVEELKRQGLAAPAVLVSRTGTRQGPVLAGPFKTFEVEMAAFVVTKDELGLSRDEAAANICAALLMHIPEKTWGQVGVGAAAGVREQPLITSASQRLAAALWAVTWTQPVSLEGLPIVPAVPLSLYVGAGLSDGAGDPAAYEQIGATP
jgi:hypothetical protein